MPMHSRYACQRLVRQNTAYTTFVEFVDPNVTLEDVMTAPYWVNVIGGFRLNDVVHAIAMDGSYEATMRIIRLGPGFIDFRVLLEWRPPVDEASGKYELGWAGPKSKWFVREVATGKKIAEGLDKPGAAAELNRLDGLKAAA